MKNDDTFRTMNGGASLDGGAGNSPSARQLGLGDKKKMTLLVVLVLAGVGVGAYQFLGGGSPATATATPTGPEATTAAASAPAAAKTDTGGMPTPAGAVPVEELTVVRIEQLVKEFDGYVRARQVALENLHSNPFRSKTTPQAAAPMNPFSAVGVEPVAVEPRRTPMPKLVLGSLMMGSDKNRAMINGRLCMPGTIISGCRVEMILPDRVVLSRDGETYELYLNPPVKPVDERAVTDGN
jgi:hypothetical protein